MSRNTLYVLTAFSVMVASLLVALVLATTAPPKAMIVKLERRPLPRIVSKEYLNGGGQKLLISNPLKDRAMFTIECGQEFETFEVPIAASSVVTLVVTPPESGLYINCDILKWEK